jgi:hypothetical protein
VVVLSVLDVVPAHDLDFAEVCILFPLLGMSISTCGSHTTHVEKVDFLEEELLVMLQLAHGGYEVVNDVAVHRDPRRSTASWGTPQIKANGEWVHLPGQEVHFNCLHIRTPMP